ncbi:MAG: hypothetical protein ACFB3T_09040 [Geminicoccaceae bacterium]
MLRLRAYPIAVPCLALLAVLALRGAAESAPFLIDFEDYSHGQVLSDKVSGLNTVQDLGDGLTVRFGAFGSWDARPDGGLRYGAVVESLTDTVNSDWDTPLSSPIYGSGDNHDPGMIYIAMQEGWISLHGCDSGTCWQPATSHRATVAFVFNERVELASIDVIGAGDEGLVRFYADAAMTQEIASMRFEPTGTAAKPGDHHDPRFPDHHTWGRIDLGGRTAMAMTLHGGNSFAVDSLSGSPVRVAAPGAAGLMLVGLLSAGWWRRRAGHPAASG